LSVDAWTPSRDSDHTRRPWLTPASYNTFTGKRKRYQRNVIINVTISEYYVCNDILYLRDLFSAV